jgi:hypothetical protein
MTNQFPGATKMVLSPAAQAVLCAYRDLSWTPDEEDNGKYYKFCHKAGMAAALRAVADQVEPEPSGHFPEQSCRWYRLGVLAYRHNLLAIAAELEGHA